MKYLFFDIECANCDLGKGKICSFGYVLTDESFKIIEEDDILINPDAPFHLTGRKDKRDIKLGYSVEEFRASPKFPEFYDRIFGLITDSNTMAIGYAVINDVNFLLSECERYSMQIPDFVYYDVQLMYSDYKNITGIVGLERAGAEFGTVTQETHVSRDDAKDTMIIAKGICDRLNVTLEDGMKLSYRAKSKLTNGEKSSLAKKPKKRDYIAIKEEIYSAKPSEDESVIKERETAFNIYSAERNIPHNYDSGVSSTSTIGELLKDLKIEV